MKCCPICERPLDCDTEVYVKRNKNRHESVEIVGCDNCVRSTWGDEVMEEDELEDSEADNYLWDMSQEMKALMAYRASKVR